MEENDQTITFDDFESICRFCMGKDDVNSLFSLQIDDMKASDVVKYAIMLEVHPDDGLPPNICWQCIGKLYTSYSFRKHSEECDILLKTVLAERKNQDEIKEDIDELTEIIKEPEESENQIVEEDNQYETFELIQEDTENNSLMPCPHCDKQIKSSKIKQHIRTHTKEKPYRCEYCTMEFSLGYNLRRHRMLHTGERPYVCHLCGKGYIQMVSLRDHFKLHKESFEAPPAFVCHLCGRQFKFSSSFNLHLRKHGVVTDGKDDNTEDDVETKYICAICTKVFKSSVRLEQHKATHEEKMFFCNECGKKFARQSSLNLHLKVHSGERPYTCVECNKTFRQSASLDAHILIHTGEKPHTCHICSKSFVQISHLNYHLRIHSGEKPYKCKYCGKAFTLKGNLTVHTRMHTGETPYVCSICNRGFYDSSSMKKHERGHSEVSSNSELNSST